MMDESLDAIDLESPLDNVDLEVKYSQNTENNQTFETIQESVQVEADQIIFGTMIMNEFTAPYHFNKQSFWPTVRFWVLRGIMYIPAFMYGLLRWIYEIILIMLGIRSTYRIPDDNEFALLFDKTLPYGVWNEYYMVPNPTPDDNGPETEEIRVIDTSDFAIIKNFIFFGTYVEPVKVIFRKRHVSPQNKGKISEWKLYQIEIKGATLIHGINSGSSGWEAAKLFALQAIHYFILMNNHAIIHFQEEKVTAATKLFFPKDHEIYQLISPHVDFTTEIDSLVLKSRTSPLFSRDTALCFYDAHTMNREGCQAFLNQCFEKAKHSPRSLTDVPDPGLQPHYNAIHELCKKVVHSTLERISAISEVASRNEEYSKLQNWTDFLERHLFYKPINSELDIAGILDSKKLILYLVRNIFDISILHSADHYFMTASDQRIHPFSICTPWSYDMDLPKKWNFGICNSSAKVVPLWNWLKQLMYISLFSEWWNNRLYWDSRLIKTTYKFKNAALQAAAKKFRETLTAIPDNYLPKNRISQSIQW
jgi:hypothetical protein